MSYRHHIKAEERATVKVENIAPDQHTFSEDGYWAEYTTEKPRSTNSVRGWCNYIPYIGPEDHFDIWVGQRCPGMCCVGRDNDKAHTHRQSIVVGVNGSCRVVSKDVVQHLGIGIYFGPDNPYNESFYIEFIDPLALQPASQRADVSAVVTALQKVVELQTAIWRRRLNTREPGIPGLDEHLLRLIVKTDSDYVVKSMNDWLEKRRETKYLTSVKKPITNKDVLEALDDWTTLLEKDGVQVVFWLVSRDRNQDAVDLAEEALERAVAKDADIDRNILKYEQDSREPVKYDYEVFSSVKHEYDRRGLKTER